MLPALTRAHDVLAPTLPGHAGGPPIDGEVSDNLMPDAVERMMDAAGFETAHIAGNSLGGFVALQLAARGRARSVVALAPAGGWPAGDPFAGELVDLQLEVYEQVKGSAAFADAIVATPEGRRRATQLLMENFEHVPAELIAHEIRSVAACDGALALATYARSSAWPLDAERIACPVRIVWGTEDRLLPWPEAAVRFQRDLLPHADWVELAGAGHTVQLDVPLEAAEIVLGITRSA